MENFGKFIGRNEELEKLRQTVTRRSAKLIVVKGRRRIGKSRLLIEFGKKFEACYIFSGLPPEKGVKPEDQRIKFAMQLKKFFKIDVSHNNWGELFSNLSEQVISKKVLLVFDEITWMAHGDHKFLPELKNAWDLEFKRNPNLVLAICGSISAWIEKNILSSTGFLGRTSLNMTVKELSLRECLQFWDTDYISAQDKLIILSVTGGVPRYLEEVNSKQTAIQNISRLCFNSDGVLFSEFDYIFSDLFSNRNKLYKKIISSLVSGAREAKDIAIGLDLPQNGDIYDYINDLITAGFVNRHYNWHFKDGKISKISHYRISDNYCRFYIKHILPHKNKIINNNFNNFSKLPGFFSVIGLQFENLVLNNRKLILKALQIKQEDIINDNPYFQRKNTRQEACQIDYLIQTRLNALFICEIKFTTKIVKKQVIDEVKQKIKKLKKPKNFSCIPVLIHFGEVQDSIEESGYFSYIIDFEEFFNI